MFLHYLKIAWRNILKYKTQSVISILGLAIGFMAFSFTMSWIRYEMGYDSHNPDADRIYRVFVRDSTEVGGVGRYAPNALASYLRSNYPEIEAATGIYPYKTDLNLNDKAIINQCYVINTDTSFLHVFYPEIKVFYPEAIDKNYHLFSKKTADNLGLGPQHIGQRIDSLQINLLNIVPDQSTHSNVPFNVIYLSKPNPTYDMSWGYLSRFTYIRVKEGIDMARLEDKLAEVSISGDSSGGGSYTTKYQFKLVPLKKLRITHPDSEVSIRYHQLKIFVTVSILVVFCAFFNYIMLFISKIKIRSRGLALQKANGASNFQLLILLFCEFISLLLVVLIVGLVLTELLYPSFVKFSMIEASKSFFLGDAVLFGISMLLLSLVFSIVPINYFMRRSIQENLLPQIQRSSGIKDRFTLITIGLQLIISVLLIFSTTVFMYQFSYLNSDHIGFDRYNINTIITYPNEIPLGEIRKIPGVEGVIRYGGDFLPKSHIRSSSIERSDTQEKYNYYRFNIFGPEFVDFFGIKIVEGRNIFEGEKNAYLINQTANRLLNTRDSTGVKSISGVPVVGVIEDMYIDSPLVPVFPSVYGIPSSEEETGRSSLFYAYKYAKGLRNATEKEIERIATEEIGNRTAGFYNMEEIYAEYTQSERYLLILLSLMTGIAILIAVFGIYSMITLSCTQRRKEIAIRKASGAKAKDIFMLFFRQYFVVTLAASVVALPFGAWVMRRWLEQYTRRIEMEWWLFVGIFVLVILIVFGSIFSRVYRAAKENPAEVVKSD